MKPLLKWAGGKRHIAEELFSSFPVDWNKGTYLEPFVGGGAMFLHLSPMKAILADLNVRLVSFYTHVKDSPEKLYENIFEIAQRFNKMESDDKKLYFLELRNQYNSSEPQSLDSAVLLYCLNKLCFNGLYRENSKGLFNVPFGQKKQFPALIKDDFLAVSGLLKNAQILNYDFEVTASLANEGDFVYFDPPYIPIDATSSFTSYHAEDFGYEDQERLAKLMIKLNDKGVRAMCSNSDTPVTREIYGLLNITTIQAPRMVSAKASGRGSVSELVITNY